MLLIQSLEKADTFVKSHLIPELTKGQIEEIKKLQHPKFILQSVTDKLGHSFLKTRCVFVCEYCVLKLLTMVGALIMDIW